ncbi:DNA-binding protein [Cupriavidus sp. TMH.W2]|uniref:DNA-binding protein n=1 Tax=Cupriavidus sp. TMH.W2 TaxID=3434465 RepID=UPI003D775FA1
MPLTVLSCIRFLLRNTLPLPIRDGSVHSGRHYWRSGMTGRKGITQVDVVRACVALMKRGRRPAARNIRLELGKGSMTTIHQHLRRLALRDARGRSGREED